MAVIEYPGVAVPGPNSRDSSSRSEQRQQSDGRDWARRIEEARRAREFGHELRKGKPTSFRASVGHWS